MNHPPHSYLGPHVSYHHLYNSDTFHYVGLYPGCHYPYVLTKALMTQAQFVAATLIARWISLGRHVSGIWTRQSTSGRW